MRAERMYGQVWSAVRPVRLDEPVDRMGRLAEYIGRPGAAERPGRPPLPRRPWRYVTSRPWALRSQDPETVRSSVAEVPGPVRRRCRVVPRTSWFGLVQVPDGCRTTAEHVPDGSVRVAGRWLRRPWVRRRGCRVRRGRGWGGRCARRSLRRSRRRGCGRRMPGSPTGRSREPDEPHFTVVEPACLGLGLEDQLLQHEQPCHVVAFLRPPFSMAASAWAFSRV